MTLPSSAVVAQFSVSPLLEDALKKLLDRQEGNQKAADYYEGRAGEVFASPQLRRVMRNTGIDYQFNFAKTPVDALTDRLEIATVKSSDAAADAAIKVMWAVNELDLEVPQMHRRAGEFGDAYVIVWPNDVDRPVVEGEDPDEVSYQAEDVGIYYNSADTVMLFYAAERPLEKSHAIKRWRTEDKRWRVDLLFDHHIERYISAKDAKGERAQDFEPLVLDYEFVEGEDGELEELPIWPAENPFGEVPVFHLRNDRPYGSPEHKGFYGPQDAITKLIIGHMSGVDYNSAPQRYALIDAESDTAEAADLDPDDFDSALGFTEDEKNAEARGEGDSQFSSAPGSLWLMRGVKGVGQFDNADPKTFLEPLERYLRLGGQITSTPLRMFDYENSQLPSGASQSQADGPFVKKVRNRQLSYGATWQDVYGFALRILGIEHADVQVLWAPPNVVDDEAGWSVIKMKLEAGVPYEQVMREAGYLADLVDEWVKQRAEQKNEPAPESQDRAS
ncbi:hypothetical protein ACIGG9_16105 [Pseudonocardia alni]|uniref:hypothetical protein n=1 Tax=Pseudonocardia alni TaxID=33907 RepID=UPI0033DF367A